MHSNRPLLAYLLLPLLLFSQVAMADKVTFDLEDGEHTSIYRYPGVDYETCKSENNCGPITEEILSNPANISKNGPIAWPDKNTDVKFLLDKKGNPIKMRVDGVQGEWYQVEVDKTWGGQAQGWIEGSYLNIPKPKRAKKTDKKPWCPPAHKDSSTKETANDAEDKALSAYEKEIATVADQISPMIGQCVIADSLPLTAPKEGWSNKKPLYDQAVLPSMSQLPAQVKAGNTTVTKEQLIEIDMLARTLYGEMAKCGHNHPEYLDVVARVAINRADFDENYRKEKKSPSEFSDEAKRFDLTHREGETPLMGVLTSSRKFNPWDMYLQKGVFNKSGVGQALCPPSTSDIFWGSYARKKGEGVPNSERNVWNKILKVATESVIFQDQFKLRTASLGDILLFQTQMTKKQNMSKFQDRPQVFRKYDGEVLNNNYCAAIYSASTWQKKYLPTPLAEIASSK